MSELAPDGQPAPTDETEPPATDQPDVAEPTEQPAEEDEPPAGFPT